MAEVSITKTEQLKAIRDAVVNLTDSSLYAYRIENHYFPVIGEGSHDAKIMFIGEGPGKNEAATGRPFCGAAGKLLDELLVSIDIPRDSVYITNILKDRTPNNRDPLPEEIKTYAPFLDQQIDIIKPVVIATLGRFSMEYIMKKFGLENSLAPISKIHGKTFSVTSLFGKIVIMPLYHPAAAIYTRDLIPVLKEDFKILKELV